jgi:hypothetical protein
VFQNVTESFIRQPHIPTFVILQHFHVVALSTILISSSVKP